MNTSYDLTESRILIDKLIRLTRDSKIEWAQRRSASFPKMARFHTTINQVPGASPFSPDEDLEALVWSTDKAAGFRLFETTVEPSAPSQPSSSTGRLYVQSKDRVVYGGLADVSERDLVAVSIDHENGPSHGGVYVSLMSLLELARRSVDKVEPKIDRVKQYLDKLAV
jgi:hypothetical protein